MSNLMIAFVDSNSEYEYRHIEYKDNNWCIIDISVSDDALLQSENIKVCTNFMYLYLKYDNSDESFQSGLSLLIYPDKNNQESVISIDLGEDKTSVANKVKNILSRL